MRDKLAPYLTICQRYWMSGSMAYWKKNDAFVKSYDGRTVSARWKEGNTLVLLLDPCGDEVAIHCKDRKSLKEHMKKYPIGYEWGECLFCKKDCGIVVPRFNVHP